ncbi:MAG: Na+/H+ antiporter NhaA [Burkholderiales bacterium]|nr:Na+/H+ antiporter NhaA [Phycisphaerae bacterium]
MRPATIPLTQSRVSPLLQPVQAFLSAESSGGILLLAAAMIALAWANSPWGDSYAHFWHAKLAITVGGKSHGMSLEHWVNDGLMVIFFVLVGLEIKRELIIGELASVRRAALPLAAAIGGMVVPALIYLALNAGGPGAAGWGIPMATDIAFAVGVLALVGRAVPTSAKVFLLAVAIVDDLGAVLVIALFYTSQISGSALTIAAAFLVGLIALNILRVHRPLPFILLGIGLWAATLYSGVHATVAGVLLAFTIPATRQIEERPYVAYMRKMLERFDRDATIVPDRITEDQSHAIKSMEEASQAVQTPLARVEHALLWPVSFLIVPLFALANAGVDLRGAAAMDSPITWGVFFGLLLGKPVGVLLASWAAIKAGVAVLPHGATTFHLVGISILCGIGFTMSLFVANLAFPGQANHLAASKVGILLASLVSGILGAAIIAIATRKASGTPPSATVTNPVD